jgi:ribose 1,5-bisphosphokinase PhnN
MVKFISRISKQGDNRIIWVPKAFLPATDNLFQKQVVVEVNLVDKMLAATSKNGGSRREKRNDIRRKIR